MKQYLVYYFKINIFLSTATIKCGQPCIHSVVKVHRLHIIQQNTLCYYGDWACVSATGNTGCGIENACFSNNDTLIAFIYKQYLITEKLS